MAYTVYSNFSGQGRLPIWSVYNILEKSGPGQNLYTQIFRGRAGSRSGAYTKSSKSPGLGRICILEFFGLGQAPGPERIQKARKVRARAEPVYSNFPGQSRLSVWSVYKKLEKSGPGQNLYTQIFRARAGSRSGAYTKSSKSPGLGRICILKFSGSEQALG